MINVHVIAARFYDRF